jgi:hypothetical protein
MNKMKTIKFLNQGNSEKVVADAGKCWKLENGHIAKKKNEGLTWIFVEDDES